MKNYSTKENAKLFPRIPYLTQEKRTPREQKRILTTSSTKLETSDLKSNFRVSRHSWSQHTKKVNLIFFFFPFLTSLACQKLKKTCQIILELFLSQNTAISLAKSILDINFNRIISWFPLDKTIPQDFFLGLLKTYNKNLEEPWDTRFL